MQYRILPVTNIRFVQSAMNMFSGTFQNVLMESRDKERENQMETENSQLMED